MNMNMYMYNHIKSISSFILASLVTAALRSPAVNAASISQQICTLITSEPSWPLGHSAMDQHIKQYYLDHQCHPLFHHDHVPTIQAKHLAGLIGRSAEEGLNPEEFHYQAIYDRIIHPDIKQSAALDLLLTKALVRYILIQRNLLGQPLLPPIIYRTIDAAMASESIASHIRSNGPWHRFYKGLKDALSKVADHGRDALKEKKQLKAALQYWRSFPYNPQKDDLLLHLSEAPGDKPSELYELKNKGYGWSKKLDCKLVDQDTAPIGAAITGIYWQSQAGIDHPSIAYTNAKEPTKRTSSCKQLEAALFEYFKDQGTWSDQAIAKAYAEQKLLELASPKRLLIVSPPVFIEF